MPRIFALITALLLVVAVQAAEPAIRLDGKSKPQGFEVVGLTRAQLERLKNADLAKRFSVRVAGADIKNQPAVVGEYKITADTLRFEPQFPLAPGVRYRVVFHPESGKDVRAEFELPKPKAGPPTVVTQVYPSSDVLPENQLKFYIQFSAPMSRGEAYKRIQLLDEKGKPVEFPFLELGEELWEPKGTRFTLFFDPGRIKRGLKPREEVGPALEENKSYTLVIDSKWTDAAGQPLKQAFRKKFRVVAPDDKTPDPKEWKIAAPRAGGKTALTVRFPEPLDHGLLGRLLWVIDPAGKRVPGQIALGDHEKLWQFTPEQVWRAGAYKLVIDTTLEDLAGNSVGQPFEVDLFKPIDKKITSATVTRTIEIKR